MGLVNIRILVVFYLHILFSTLTAYTLGEFPSIRPVPCENRMTGETGICTFNWSCINVAHGVHIGPCVDRFFVGSCCKIPDNSVFAGRQTTSYSYEGTETAGATEAAKEDYEVGSFSKITVSTARPTTKKKVKDPLPMKNNSNDVINSQVQHEYYGNSDSISKPDKDIDSLLPTTTSIAYSESLHKPPLSLLSRKPILPTINDSFSSSKSNHFVENAESFSGQKISIPIASSENLSGNIPLQEKHSTATHSQQYSSIIPESPQEQITVKESWKNNIRLQQQNLSKFTESPLSLPPSISNTLKYDSASPSNDKISSYQISIVLDDSVKHIPQLGHPSDNIPGNTFSTWAYNFLSNKSNNTTTLGNIISYNTSSETKTNAIILPSASTIGSLYPSQPSVSESQHAQDFSSSESALSNSTENEIDILTTVKASSEFENSLNIDDDVLKFTKFTEPQYPWPSSKPITDKESGMTTAETVVIRNVSRVCGRSRSNIMARIVGGRKSHYLRWPWMISLRRFEEKTFKHKCGAALLNQFWTITAAHCVDGKLPNDVVLRLGDYNFQRSDEFHPHVERRIYMIVIHPEFDPATYENDLALLRFYEPVRFQANIVPVCLPKFNEDLAGRTAVVTGWGRLSEEGELPGSLHEVHMPILTNKECEEMYSQAGYPETIRDVFVCAGLMRGGLDACEGDSGGPMVIKGERGEWTLVGLISWGMGCAAPRQPGVYTRISKFVDWIDEIITY